MTLLQGLPRPGPILLKFLPIMLLSSAQKSCPSCSIICSFFSSMPANFIIFNEFTA